MKNMLVALLVASSSICLAQAAHAQYAGQTITGSLAFGPNGANGGQYWPMTTIIDPGTFSYADFANTDTAAFTANTLTITDVEGAYGANGFQMVFSDTALPFSFLTLVSDNFSPDLTYSLSGGDITIDWVGNSVPGTYVATFDIGPPTGVPEPASLAVLVAGLTAVSVARRRRKI